MGYGLVDNMSVFSLESSFQCILNHVVQYDYYLLQVEGVCVIDTS